MIAVQRAALRHTFEVPNAAAAAFCWSVSRFECRLVILTPLMHKAERKRARFVTRRRSRNLSKQHVYVALAY